METTTLHSIYNSDRNRFTNKTEHNFENCHRPDSGYAFGLFIYGCIVKAGDRGYRGLCEKDI